MSEQLDRFAVVEQMGHRKIGARITEVEEFGQKFVRAEVLVAKGENPVQLIHPQSIYAITICSEEIARKVNANTWTLRQAVPSLPEPAAEEPDDDAERCESCRVYVSGDDVRHDVEGVPFCVTCFDEMAAGGEHVAPDDPEDVPPEGGAGDAGSPAVQSATGGDFRAEGL